MRPLTTALGRGDDVVVVTSPGPAWRGVAWAAAATAAEPLKLLVLAIFVIRVTQSASPVTPHRPRSYITSVGRSVVLPVI